MMQENSLSTFIAIPELHPRLNGLLGGADAITKTKSQITKTHRISLELFQTNEKKFPEFNFRKLIKNLNQPANEVDNQSANGFSDDEDDKLKQLAKKFEEKYGSSKKGGRSVEEFVDIGYGYDETDPFLDNTEAYDEVVPSDWTTEHGGFYINQGNLDFRPLSPDQNSTSLLLSSKKKKKKKIKSDLSKTPKELSIQKKKHQFLSKEKQRKRQESLLKAHKILVKKKKKKPLPIIDESSQDVIHQDKSFDDDIPLAKIVKEQIDIPLNDNKASKDSQDDDIPLAKISVTPSAKASAKLIVKTPTTKSPVQVTPTTSMNGVCSGEKIKVETPLPEDLNKDLLDEINKLKKIAVDGVRGKFFTGEVNKIMLSFARHTRNLSPKLRNTVYDHIVYYLPCAKDTLSKRCRGLVVQHQKGLEDEPMKLLQKGITDSMPAMVKAYDDEVALHLQEQAREQIKQTGVDPKGVDINEETNGSDDKNKKSLPKKKYDWSDEVRTLLCNVIKVRVGLFKMSKSKSMTAEEYVKDFLESEIRVMWPKGWMTSRILYKESRGAHCEITQPMSKAKKAALKKVEEINSSDISPLPNLSRIITTSKTLTNNIITTSSIVVPSSKNIVINKANLNVGKCSGTKINSSQNVEFKTPMSLQGKTVIISSPTLKSVSLKKVVQNHMQGKKDGSPIFVHQGNKQAVIPNSSTIKLIKSDKTVVINNLATTGINKLPSNLKIVSNNKNLGQANANFISMNEKSSFMTSTIRTCIHNAKPYTTISPSLNNRVTPQNTVSKPHNKTSSYNNQEQNNNSVRTVCATSPKVSPFVSTPTFVRNDAKIVAPKIDPPSQQQQVKRKSLFDDHNYTMPNKKVMSAYDFATPPHKSTNDRSWSEMATDLERLSSGNKTPQVRSDSQDSGILTELSTDDLSILKKTWNQAQKLTVNATAGNRIVQQANSLHKTHEIFSSPSQKQSDNIIRTSPVNIQKGNRVENHQLPHSMQSMLNTNTSHLPKNYSPNDTMLSTNQLKSAIIQPTMRYHKSVVTSLSNSVSNKKLNISRPVHPSLLMANSNRGSHGNATPLLGVSMANRSPQVSHKMIVSTPSFVKTSKSQIIPTSPSSREGLVHPSFHLPQQSNMFQPAPSKLSHHTSQHSPYLSMSTTSPMRSQQMQHSAMEMQHNSSTFNHPSSHHSYQRPTSIRDVHSSITMRNSISPVTCRPSMTSPTSPMINYERQMMKPPSKHLMHSGIPHNEHAMQSPHAINQLMANTSPNKSNRRLSAEEEIQQIQNDLIMKSRSISNSEQDYDMQQYLKFN